MDTLGRKDVLDCLEYKYLWVLMLDDVLIGYLISSIVQDECHIMNLCIKNDYESYGYGKYLLTSLHNEIRTLNCKLLFLECVGQVINWPSIYIRQKGIMKLVLEKTIIQL